MVRSVLRALPIALVGSFGCSDREASSPPTLRPVAVSLGRARLPAIVDAAALGANRWAVLDRTRHVTIVDTLGTATSTIDLSDGRSRELYVPFSIAARRTGQFAVADMASGKVAEFTADGKFDRIVDVGGPARALWWTGSQLVVKSVVRGRVDFLGLGEDGHSPPSLLESVDVGDASRATCSYCAAAVDAAGNIAMARRDTEYSVARAHGGQFAKGYWARSGVTPGHYSAHDRDSLGLVVDQALSELRKEGQSESYIRGFRTVLEERFRHKPLIHGRALAFDSLGALWVQPSVDPPDSSVLDVFAPSGRFVTRVAMGKRMTLLAISNGQVLLRSNTADSLGRLFAYRIMRY